MLKPGGKLLTVSFGEELEGYQSGEEIETGTWQNIKEGVLVDRGLSHIYTEKEFLDVIKDAGFSDVRCDYIKYTDNGHKIHQYICTAEK